MNEQNVEEQMATESVEQEEVVADVEQAPTESQPGDGNGLPVRLSPEEVPLTYSGFRNPQNEAEIHYELATLDVLIKSLETRKARLQRDWTHYKLTIHLNHAALNGENKNE